MRSTRFYIKLKKIIKTNPFVANLKYYKEKNANQSLPIAYRNWWSSEFKHLDEDWFMGFVRDRMKVTVNNPIICIFSVFGRKNIIKRVKQEHLPIMFYTGENVYSDLLTDRKEYADHCLNDVDLALGFADIKHEKYLRFPIWLCYDFPVIANIDSIKKQLKLSQKRRQAEKNKFCTLVASHDFSGLRTKLFNTLAPIDAIDSAGRLLNNTNRLKSEFNDNKIDFLGDYRFNICPENSNEAGYVTEKVFDALMAGTAPIYWGGDNNPEPEVLNKDAILFYSEERPIEELYKRVGELYQNKKMYKEFMAQEAFLSTAAEYIADKLNTLELRLESLIKNI